MKRALQVRESEATERQALRRQVKRFYTQFNKANWRECHLLIDPQLIRKNRVDLGAYSERMQAFKDAYGSIKPWFTRLSLHLQAAPKQADRRPFAYVYVVWQDEAHGFHIFRERWVKDDGQWFTRVVGLVPNQQASTSAQD